MAFLRHVTLVITYFLTLIMSSWVLEFILFWTSGYNSFQIIESLHNLSISQLQALLVNRGISQTSLREKSEIVKCLQSSGPVQYLELMSAISPSEPQPPLELSRSEDFHDQISEETESLWLVEVIPYNLKGKERILNESTWMYLNMQLPYLGINAAILQCEKDSNLCDNYGWDQPQLAIIIPKFSYSVEFQNKFQNKFQCTSNTPLSYKAVMHWLHSQLSQLVKNIESVEELETVWLNTTVAKRNKISHLVYFTTMMNAPLLLITLGLRFSSRIRIVIFNTGQSNKNQTIDALKKHQINGTFPRLVFTSAECISSYGKKKGELFTFNALESYIRILQPTTDELFLLSLCITNAVALVGFLGYRRCLWQHILRTLGKLLVYNLWLFIAWMLLNTTIGFTWVRSIFEASLQLLKILSCTDAASIVAYHIAIWQHYTSIFLIAYVVLLAFMYVLGKWFNLADNDGSENEESWYLMLPGDSYLLNMLFRPIGSLSRQWPSQDLALDEGMDLLIERLATPDIWLRPLIPKDYIKRLPLWRYNGWGNEEDLRSESETDLDSFSEAESERLLTTYSCCDKRDCKMCSLWTAVKNTHVCHRCAILKRKLESQYFRYTEKGDIVHQRTTYEKLISVYQNCLRTNKQNVSNLVRQTTKKSKGFWPISIQDLIDLRWIAPKYAIEIRSCVICLDRYRWSAVLCGLPCGHTFHYSCIMEWLANDHHHCPTCRWPSYKNKALNISVLN